jgi:type VI secretion system secreted protein Hcp
MAQTDMFLKLDDIKGESADDTHGGEIQIDSWSWGVANTGSGHEGGGSGAGKAHFSDLTVTKKVDKASPVLIQMCAAGTIIQNALLTVRKAGGKKPVEHIKITMNQVLISGENLSAGSALEVVETLTLNFASYKFEYVPQKADQTADASVVKGWHIPNNKAI